MGFKENLRRLRERFGLTQTEMARRAGVPFRSYQNWEMGSREPRLDGLSALAKALGVSADELLAESSERPAQARGRPPKATPASSSAEDLEKTAKRSRGQAKKP
jgi:transcriptional regulator with XRE-family HTH domain